MYKPVDTRSRNPHSQMATAGTPVWFRQRVARMRVAVHDDAPVQVEGGGPTPRGERGGSHRTHTFFGHRTEVGRLIS
jgi:hypothetical protein